MDNTQTLSLIISLGPSSPYPSSSHFLFLIFIPAAVCPSLLPDRPYLSLF